MKHDLDALERAAKNGTISQSTRSKVVVYQKFLKEQRDQSHKKIEQCQRILEIK